MSLCGPVPERKEHPMTRFNTIVAWPLLGLLLGLMAA